MTANGKAGAAVEAPATTGRVLPKETTISAVQAGIEGVPVNVDGLIRFQGSTFRIAEKVGLMPMLKFAHAASSGATEDDMEGMAAMYAMIRDCIDPQDWPRFERVAMDTHAEGEELMAVVEAVLEAVSARPTQPPSGSSPPERNSSRKSKRGLSQRGSVVPPQAEGLVGVGELLLSSN
jgi:hypothetical protein